MENPPSSNKVPAHSGSVLSRRTLLRAGAGSLLGFGGVAALSRFSKNDALPMPEVELPKEGMNRAELKALIAAQGPLTRADFEKGVTIAGFSLKLEKTVQNKQQVLGAIVVNGKRWELAGKRFPADKASTLSFSDFAWQQESGNLHICVLAKKGMLPIPKKINFSTDQVCDLIIALAEGHANVPFADNEGKDTGADLVLNNPEMSPEAVAANAGEAK